MLAGGSPDRVWMSFDIPEELGWDILAFALGDEGPAWIADWRRDLDDRTRWEDDGGTVA